MKKILAAALAAVALVGGALALTAFRAHRDPAAFVTARVEKMLSEVNATDAQRQQILAIEDKLLADGKALHASQAGTHQQLLALWQADQPDAAQVHQLVNARTDAMKSFANEIADAILQVHDILTPDQRAQVAQHVQQHMQEHQQGQQ